MDNESVASVIRYLLQHLILQRSGDRHAGSVVLA